MLVAEIAELQGAVGTLDELFYARLRFAELFGGLPQQLYAFFEEAERRIQIEPFALQLPDNLLKARKVRFE
jgi:hypothetical protein